jgi:hypothetical protein
MNVRIADFGLLEYGYYNDGGVLKYKISETKYPKKYKLF